MPCTGDRELYFNVIRNPVCALAVEVNRGEKFAHVESSIGMRFHADVLPNNRSRDLTPSDTCRRTRSSGDPASEKCDLSVSEPQRKNKHNIWEGDRVNTNTVDAGQTCIWGGKIINGSVVSQVWNIQGQTWLCKHKGLFSVLAWWWVDYMHREHVNRAQVLLGRTRGVKIQRGHDPGSFQMTKF